MDTRNDITSWDKWKTEQVQTITQILSTVFKVEDEAQQMQAPSRLLRRSSKDSPEAEAEIREKLTQIRKQISEYEEMLKIGLKRVDTALEKIEPVKANTKPQPSIQKISFFGKLKALFSR
jgi:septation ring formation regulator EzrA